MNALQRNWVIGFNAVVLIIILFVFPVDHSLHYLLSHLLYIQVLIGLIYYRKWVIPVTLILVGAHITLDWIALCSIPENALYETGIALIILLFGYAVFHYHFKIIKRYEETIDAARLGIWEWNVQSDEIVINDSWAEMLGYSVDELRPLTIKTWEALTYPQDLKKAYNQLNKLINKEEILYDTEIRMLHKDGHIVWIYDTGQVTEYDKNNNPLIMRGTHTDITEKKQIEQHLKHQRHLMSYVVKHMNNGVAIHDKDLNYIYVSNHYKKQYNVTEDIIGKHHYDVFPNLPEKWKKAHQKALQGEVSSSTRDKYIREDKTVEWTRWECRPWYDETNTIGGIIVYTEVITDLLKKERELEETTKTLETTLDNVPIGIAINSVEPEVNFEYMNDKFPKIYNTTKEALLHDDFMDVVYENKTFRKKLRKQILDDVHSGDYSNMQWNDIPITEHGKVVRYVNASNIPHPNKKQYISTVIDVTNQKKLELSLSKQAEELFIEKEKIKATLLSIGDAVVATDYNGIIETFNDTASKISGYTKEEAIGSEFSSIIRLQHETTNKSMKSPVTRVIESKQTMLLENHTVVLSKNGSKYLIEDSAAPIYDQEKNIIGVIVVFRDVTEKKQKEREISYLSIHDYLTGLYNRRYFAEELARRDNPNHYPLGIMMMDLNGLKILNDAYGHDIGDKALKRVSQTIKEVMKDRGVISRIGGDEFTALISNTTNNELNTIKEQLNKAISKSTVQTIELSMAIGYTIKESQKESFKDVLKKAEDIMYKYKISEGISARNKTIQAILHTLTDKYELERIHSENVSRYAKYLGEALNLHKDDLKELELSGLFHDIGKISIQDSILNKKGKLTKEEYDIIKGHTKSGYQILRAADEYSDMAEHALLHHEWVDGSGYPEGLTKEDIPLFARIISIVDAFDAMTSDRPYRKARSIDYAVNELKAYSNKQFDEELVHVFIKDVIPNIKQSG